MVRHGKRFLADGYPAGLVVWFSMTSLLCCCSLEQEHILEVYMYISITALLADVLLLIMSNSASSRITSALVEFIGKVSIDVTFSK